MLAKNASLREQEKTLRASDSLRPEVIGMILEEFDEERFKKNMREEGYEDGVNDKAMEDAENFLKADVDPETVAKCIGLPLEQVMKIKENLSVCESATDDR